jgi:hypothetical protein
VLHLRWRQPRLACLRRGARISPPFALGFPHAVPLRRLAHLSSQFMGVSWDSHRESRTEAGALVLPFEDNHKTAAQAGIATTSDAAADLAGVDYVTEGRS